MTSPSFPLPSARPLLLITPFFLWGTAMVAMKGTLDHTTPLFLATVRLLPAGLLILAVAAMLKKPQPQGWQSWAWILAFALVDASLFQGLLAEGLQRTGAGLGSVMIDSQPLAVALLASWLFGERIGPWGWLGLTLGIGGICLLGLPDEWILHTISSIGDRLQSWLGLGLSQASQLGQSSTGQDSLEVLQSSGLTMPKHWFIALFHNGEWLMLLAALSMAGGTILSRYVSQRTDPIVATGWHMILGGLPLALMTWQLEPQAWSMVTTSDWLALSYSSVFGSAIAYGLFFYFAASGSLTSLSSLTFLTPIFALSFGSLFLGEVLSNLQAIGVGLTLISIYLINQREQIEDKATAVLTDAASSPLNTSLPPSSPATKVPASDSKPQ